MKNEKWGLRRREQWRLAEFVRFGMVGVLATAIHYGVYYVLLPWATPTVAYTAGCVVSLACNYVLSSRFTFRVPMSGKRTVAFLCSHAVNYAVGVTLLNLTLLLGVPARWAPLPVIALQVPVNFLLVRTALTKHFPKWQKTEKEKQTA